MREQAPRPKAERIVAIPKNLRAFLREVHERIEAEDEAAIHESDDMLQGEGVYGGLTEEGGTLYGFTYFSGEYANTKFENAASWEILLDRSEVAEVAAGRRSELTLWACQVVGCGNKFSDPAQLCFYHDYADGATA